MKGSAEYISEGKIFHGSIPHVMGTRLEMLAVGASEDVVMPLWKRLHDLVFRLEGILNRFDPTSEISVLNMSDNPLELEMSEELKEMVELSDMYYDMTAGLFDVVDSDGKLDFGGFAKGYFLKKCDSLLRRKGVECAFVDFGGSSILGIGRHPYGDSWKVGVVNPYTKLQLKEISLVDRAMSTSGNTPSYTGHIRHPHTGEKCETKKLVTVVSGDPLDAEVLSTVLMIALEEESSMILKNFPEVQTDIMCL